MDFPLKLCAPVQLAQSIFPLMDLANFLRQSSDESFEYEEGKHYFSRTFYEGLRFLVSKEKESPNYATVSELSNFLISQKEAEQFGLFIQFLFDHQLIKTDSPCL